MIKYWLENTHSLIKYTLEHALLVSVSLILSLLLASLIILFFLNENNWLDSVTVFFSGLYSIPSYALFALLIPITGLGNITAIIVLSLYAEYVLLRSFITGIREVDPKYIEIGLGLGLTEEQVFKEIQLPMAIQSIFSGIRIALTSLIGIATIGATINAGGLGTVLFQGLRQQSVVILLWGTIMTVLLTLMMNIMLNIIVWFVVPKTS